MLLNQLRPPIGATKKRTRLGRGDASGHGGTSGRGHKGQKSRAGGYHKVGYEGGQMPLVRRLPKRGFTNVFKKEFAVVNVGDLDGFPAGQEIDFALLKGRFGFGKILSELKVLGHGEIKVALNIKASKFSKSAIEKIEKAGGKAIVVG